MIPRPRTAPPRAKSPFVASLAIISSLWLFAVSCARAQFSSQGNSIPPAVVPTVRQSNDGKPASSGNTRQQPEAEFIVAGTDCTEKIPVRLVNKVDLVWIIDGSSSMADEVARVKENLRSFVDSAKLRSDLKVAMITNVPSFANIALELPDVELVSSAVGSTNALAVAASASCPESETHVESMACSEDPQPSPGRICGKDLDTNWQRLFFPDPLSIPSSLRCSPYPILELRPTYSSAEQKRSVLAEIRSKAGLCEGTYGSISKCPDWSSLGLPWMVHPSSGQTSQNPDIAGVNGAAGKLSRFFRADARRVYVFVTDDNVFGVTEDNFLERLRPHAQGQKISLYAFRGISPRPAVSTRPGCEIARKGLSYDKLVAKADGGGVFDICETDWKPYFTQMSDGIKQVSTTGYKLSKAGVTSVKSVTVDGKALTADAFGYSEGLLSFKDGTIGSNANEIQIKYQCPAK